MLRILVFGFMLLVSCSGKEQPDRVVQQTSEIVSNEPTEENMAARKAGNRLEIGINSQGIIKSLRQVKTYSDMLHYSGTNDRTVKQLDFGAFLLSEDLSTRNKLEVNLTYVVENDSVRYGVVSIWDTKGVEILNKKEFIKNNAFLSDYLSRHNALYQTHKKIADFKAEINQNDPLKTFAGYAGDRFGDREIKLFKAVKDPVDYPYILDLLTSVNPEDQALGIIGIEKLRDKGIMIDAHCNQIITHLKTRNSTINYWFTCVSGTSKLNKFLNSRDINWNKTLDLEIKAKK